MIFLFSALLFINNLNQVAGLPPRSPSLGSFSDTNFTIQDGGIDLSDPSLRIAIMASLGNLPVVVESAQLPSTHKNPSTESNLIPLGASRPSTVGITNIGNFGTSRRDMDGLMNMTAQRGSMIMCDNSTTYSVAVEPSEIIPFLHAADAYGTQQWHAGANGTDDISNYFRYTNGSLSFVAQSYGEAATGDAFSWADFATITRWLASVTPEGSSDNRTWIGTISGYNGSPYVDFAISPAFGDSFNETTNRTKEDVLEDVWKAESNGGKLVRRGGRSNRYIKLGTTGFLMAVHYGKETVDRINLMSLAGLADTQIRMDEATGFIKHYLAGTPWKLRPQAVKAIGPDALRVFEFTTVPGKRFAHTMLALVGDALYELAAQMMRDYAHKANALYGEIVDNHDNVIATWQLGYPSAIDIVKQGLSCPAGIIKTLNGNLYGYSGCFVKVKDEL